MNDATKRIFDVCLGVIGVLIACFGLWRYFDERAQDNAAAAQERALALIEEHGGPAMIEGQTHMHAYWSSHPAFVAHIRTHALTTGEYAAFVGATFPVSEYQAEVRAFLMQTASIFERAQFCDTAGLCDRALLHAYFCPIAATTQRVYGPFFDHLNQEIGATNIGAGVAQYVESC
ncbi:hypothetical protein [Roseobacter sinensis]|uniref:TipAS antibiotic-recognition domain-containing protein n=1 Tax=Roseobacter sinensis TaxID=2931391 RepID=A0ABT3BER0_9RHOB|nr:hypothetical protein [Roseobacter sp. WL0113]MCV3272037.1 hypothetical protein [Roseobacter sp. WL0113]